MQWVNKGQLVGWNLSYQQATINLEKLKTNESSAINLPLKQKSNPTSTRTLLSLKAKG